MSEVISKMRSSLFFAAAFAVLSSSVLAQGAGTPPGQPSFGTVTPDTIAQFKSNPHALLTTHASAGLPLATHARGLLLTDPKLIDSLILVAKDGNDAQQAAIGAGLAQASRILVRTDPQLAATIQQKVAQSGLSQLITAYIAGSNDIETAATGGGAGGGGGGGGGSGQVGGVSSGGGSGGSNTGTNAGATSTSTTNSFAGFTTGGTGSSTPGGTTGGGTTIITTTSVSPTT